MCPALHSVSGFCRYTRKLHVQEHGVINSVALAIPALSCQIPVHPAECSRNKYQQKSHLLVNIMKFSLHILAIGILICLILPAMAADTLSVSISSGSGSVEIPPENVSVYLDNTRTAVNERNWSEALLRSAQGIAYYPESADLICLQAYTYRKMGMYPQSIDVVTKAIRLDPRAVRYANRGYGYLALRNYPSALADAESGIATDSAYMPNYDVKALALQGMGRNTEALAAAARAVSLEPGNAHSWHVNGMVLAAGGNCTGARSALERSIAIDPDYSLPFPGFASARESLAALNAICTPSAAQVPASPQPTKSPLGWIAAVGFAGALCVIRMRK